MFNLKNTILASLPLALLLSGCGSDSDDSSKKTQMYKLTLTNVTYAQTFSPPAVIVQNDTTNFDIYKVGEKSSVALEKLAEGGDTTDLLNDAKTAKVLYENKFSAAIAPGESKSITFTVDKGDVKFSLATMLIKTNDGFVAINNKTLGSENKKSFNLAVYDAGTEANDELNSTIPALGGQGFNTNRNDNDKITIHPGVVSSDDGLSTSNLKSTDKWDNPAAILTIEKIY